MTALITRPDTLPHRYDKDKFKFLALHVGKLVMFKSRFGSEYYGYVRSVELRPKGSIYVDMLYMAKWEYDGMRDGTVQPEFVELNAFDPSTYTFEEIA